MTCIYCDGQRNDRQMSLEHIWPQALGGAAAPLLFKTRMVCQTCNRIAGTWVDGAFLKSWFISHERGQAARQFLDPARPSIVPPSYIGIDQRFPTQPGEVAELWMGGGGDSIHYVHSVDDESWYGFAGGNIVKRKTKDPGRAYLVLRSESHYWAVTSLLSFLEHFRGARLFTVTQIGPLSQEIQNEITSEAVATPIELTEISWIRNEPSGEPHHAQFEVRADFSDRFLAKIALGVGHNLFGLRFLQSPYTVELRKALWFKPGGDSPQPQVFGVNYLSHTALSGSPLNGIRGAWSIILKALPDAFAIFVSTPGGHTIGIKISDQPSLWKGAEFDIYKSGAFFFAIPQRSLFLGPVPMLDFLSHHNGHKVNDTMAQINALKTDAASLPPLHPKPASP